MSYINKELLIDTFEAKADMATGTPKQLFFDVAKMISLIPPVNVTEVIRCKDCKCYELMTSNNQHFCNRFGGYVEANDYCSRAERN